MSVSLLFKATDLIDRYLLNSLFSLVSVGEYAIAVKISNFYNILLSAVAFAWMPYVLSIKNDDKLKQTIKVFANLFILASIVLTSFIILFQKEILAFFAPNYLISGKLIPIIISYLFINGFVYFFTLGIQLKKITRIFTYAAIFSVLTNVLSSIFLSKYFQESGIALGSLLGSVIWVAILFYFSQKKINIRYNYSLIISSLILYLLVVILSYFIDSIYLRILLFGIVFLISMPIIILIIKKNKIILDE
jgi:O-antigen/teichoic acid export membrane protein